MLSKLLPEHRIFLKTGDDQTRYFRITPKAQAIVGGIALLGICWSLVATSALVLGVVSADSEASQAQVIHDAYEDRIAELSAERDQRAREAAAIQERFRLALGEISEFQKRTMELDREREELTTALGLMRQKLHHSVAGRDEAKTEATTLLAQLDAVTGSMSAKVGAADEVAGTLSTISEALSQTVEERDATELRLAEAETKLAELEFRARMEADKQERIFSQLEDAVDVTFGPLAKLLEASGKDVDYMIERVKAQYSGEGGPYVPASLPVWAEDDPVYQRYHKLMLDLDQLHVMQIAASQIPFATPVNTSVRYTSGFGKRRDPINGRTRSHNGQDLAGPPGTPILATGDGTVIFAGRQSGFGNMIKIRHAFGYETLYAHLNRINVKTGQSVSRGDVIGGMGSTGRSTGTHLHYEIRIDGKPTNPMPYMKAARNVF